MQMSHSNPKGKYSRRLFLKSVGMVAGAVALGSLWTRGQGTIKIGLMAPQQIVFGEGMVNGATLAVEEINAAGGVLGRQLELVLGNTQTDSDPTVAVSVYQSLAGQTSAIVGLFRSEMVQAILPQVPGLKKPTLITGSTSFGTDLVQTRYEDFKYLFRSVIVNTYSLVVDMARFAGDYLFSLAESRILPNKKLLLLGEDLSSSRLFLSLVGPLLARLGFQVEGPLLIAVGTSDMGPVISRVQQFGAGAAITFLSDPNLSILFPVAVARARLPIMLFGINAPLQSDSGVQAAGGAAAGYVIADFSADAPVAAPTQKFFRAYETKFQKRPVYTAGTTYDSLHILAAAIRRANGTDAGALVTELEATNYIGAGGLIKYFDRAEPRNPAENITINTRAGELTVPNTRDLGVIKLALKQSHDTVYGFNEVPNNDPTAFDGVRPVYTEIRADGSRPVLYPIEFATLKIIKAAGAAGASPADSAQAGDFCVYKISKINGECRDFRAGDTLCVNCPASRACPTATKFEYGEFVESRWRVICSGEWAGSSNCASCPQGSIGGFEFVGL
jgi:branched-chain amino acid transport system substrate-binding protein